MRYRYGPHDEEEPEPWPAFQPASPVQEPGDPYADYPTNPGYPTDQDYLTWLDEPADAARSKGLRHLSRLTFLAAQLSTAAAVGFAALFAQAAHTQAVTSPAPARTSRAPAAVSPSPAGSSPSPTARPSPSASTGSASHVKAGAKAAAPAPTHTLAPPATAPAAPPPSPAPVQTTTSGTTGG
ncbi:MAG TPA: hypothetical protein VH480_12015 [Streptosporangiaceae bacterium]|jgi:hypothetical protein